jgi:hypothetical protein
VLYPKVMRTSFDRQFEMETEEDGSAGAVMAKAGEVPSVGRRDWEDLMTVEWNKRHAHVPLSYRHRR